MVSSTQIRSAHTTHRDPVAAVEEFHSQLAQDGMSLVLFFCSSRYDLDTIAREIDRLFEGVLVVGCTTAGEIGPEGYLDYSLSGASFPAESFQAVSGLIHPLHQFEIAQGKNFIQGLMRHLESIAPQASSANSFAFLMIDGLSQQEEPVSRSIYSALGGIPMFGGSAGDDLKFNKTLIFHGGAFHSDSAVLVLASTQYLFRLFKTQHFSATEQRMVVTAADASRRLVSEINGLPAAEEYARMVGVDVNDLNPMRFATSPVVVLIDGHEYVRSIQKVNPDGSLTFYCAIDEGIVLRVARGVDLIDNLNQSLDQIHREIGRPQALIACDCILRNLEITQDGLKQTVADIFRYNHTIGFSTYGEQYAGVHVNQTFTGLAIGSARRGDHEQ